MAALDSGSPAQTGTAKWRTPSRVVSVLENSPTNTLKVRLLPTDPDLPPHTQPFTSSISGGRDSKLFSIDPSSGWTGRVA